MTARLTLFAVVLCLVSKSHAEDSQAEFVSIFDGRSLAGWTVMPAETASAWTADDGMIIGVGHQTRSYLVYNQHEIADFEMKLSYRIPGKGNSGINLRAIPDETGKRDFKAYHVDFGHLGIGKNVLGAWDFHTPGRTEHRCFRGDSLVIDQNDQATITPLKDALTPADIRQGQWNDVHVKVVDNHFWFSINSRPASEFTEHLPAARRLHKGMIQLQLHDPNMIVHFKNVQIKVLK